MSIARRIILCGALVVGIASVPTGQAAEPPSGVQIGMVQGMFRDVQPALVQAMSRPLRDLIQKQTGLTGDVEIVPDAQILADRIKKNRYQLGVFHGYEYAWVKAQNPNLVPMVVTIPPGRRLQACIIVRQDATIQSVADMKDDSVLVPRGTKAHCLLYLDRLRQGLPANTAAPKTRPAVTPEEALDAVINGDATAALVDASALTGYQNLQPGAYKQLRVLAQSETFPQTVVTYAKGSLDEGTANQIRRLLTEAHSTSAGKPLLMLWNLKGFEEVPADYEKQLDTILKAYPRPATAARPLPVTPAGGTGMEE